MKIHFIYFIKKIRLIRLSKKRHTVQRSMRYDLGRLLLMSYTYKWIYHIFYQSYTLIYCQKTNKATNILITRNNMINLHVKVTGFIFFSTKSEIEFYVHLTWICIQNILKFLEQNKLTVIIEPWLSHSSQQLFIKYAWHFSTLLVKVCHMVGIFFVEILLIDDCVYL